MNPLTYKKSGCGKSLALLGAVALILLSACSSDTVDPPSAGTPGNNNPAPDSDFQIRSSNTDLVLVEGNQNGLRIPLSITRNNGHAKPIQLEVRGRTVEDVAFVTSSFSNLTLTPSEDESEAVLKLSIADLPIRPQQREFLIIANDGTISSAIPISVSVQPTSAPDVYLLAGQSNMVGFSGEGTRQEFAGGADEPNPRIKQLNVTKNDGRNVFNSADDYIAVGSNVVEPGIVTALDPLHVPQDPNNNSGKDFSYIGLGLSFAKNALPNTTADILLVPAAWSGSSFCKGDAGAPAGNWMAQASSNPNLGNTLLFDRAVARANLALQRSGGVFRGILWHQGESDANGRCASSYTENLKNMVQGMRNQILTVGDETLRRQNATIPFVLGTMSRGVDERDDLSVFLEDKQLIDNAHKSFPNIVDFVDGQEVPIHAALSNHDDLIPSNGYSCGNTTCIHFGPKALREMGTRYYQALLRAVVR